MKVVKNSLNLILSKVRAIRRTRKLNEQREFIDTLLNNSSFTVVENNYPKHVKKLGIVIPSLIKYSGGLTSVLRIGTQLYNNGYAIDYIVCSEQTVSEIQNNAKFNLNSVKGNFIKYETCDDEYDVIIATYWTTAYYLQKFTGYKMYFVQDYEPYFYKFGEEYNLVKKTYEMGYHIVSLGKWNLKMISREVNPTHSLLNYIDFPYEKSEYKFYERKIENYIDKKSFTIAVYIKDEGKRFPCLIPHILDNLFYEFQKDNITLNIKYFGIEDYFQPKIGKNLGKLTKKELEELYHSADFGFVASMTNISLIPYEMIATGLPLIEFQEGTFKDFFPSNCAILTTFDYLNLYEKLKYYLDNPNKIIDMINYSYQYINKFSWEKTGKQFVKIIKELEHNE